eukprot:scaffold2041_cov251-Pinguiococcus_pyrenoidosus.AAC.10
MEATRCPMNGANPDRPGSWFSRPRFTPPVGSRRVGATIWPYSAHFAAREAHRRLGVCFAGARKVAPPQHHHLPDLDAERRGGV